MDYKNIFIVDPVRAERIQLAKFLMQENFTVLGFVNIADCAKKSNQVSPDLVIYVLRKGKTELNHLLEKARNKTTPYVVLVTPQVPEANLAPFQEVGFTNISKANNQEKVREITYGLLAPDGLVPRTESPHPIPLI